MPLSVFPKKTFSLIALFAAATLVPTHGESVPVKSIDSAEALRETLTAVTDTENGATATYNGYTLEIAPAELVIPVTPGTVSTENPTGILVPLADKITIAGNGSAATTLRTDGAGDFFGIELLEYRFENLKIAGSGTGANDADGRFAILSGAKITVGGDTVFTDRFFSANEKTLNGASGGIFHSSGALDLITLDASAGAITFNAITTYGDTLTKTDESGKETTSETSAAGGAIFLSGTLSANGSQAIAFSGNKAESKAADAWGGAIYVAAATEKPENYGLKVGSGTQVQFSQNAAIGKNAQGGAVLLAGGAFSGTGTQLEFSGNTALANGEAGAAAGGALALGAGASAKFDAASKLAFSANQVNASGDFALAAGGAVYVADSTLKLEAADICFSGNAATTSADGAKALGGALAFSGESAVEFSVASANAQIEFSQNRVIASGASKEQEIKHADGSAGKELRVPEALGGALAISGGKFNFTHAGTALFSENSASVSTADALAAGGAIAISGEKTEAGFALGVAGTFSKNQVSADGAGTARGGAIFQEAGTLKVQAGAALRFEENAASGTGVGAAIVNAQGGALALVGGTQTYVSNNNAAIVFSANNANVESEASGSSARGGAIALTKRGARLSLNAATEFSGNTASAKLSGSRGQNDARTAAAGGAIYSSGTLELAGAKFSGNTAQTLADGGIADGGAIYVAGGALSAKALSFSGNAVKATDAAGTAVSGIARGGAVYLSSGTLDSAGATFSVNTASGEIARGGSLYVGSVYNLKTSGASSFSGNRAEGTQEASGGAAYVGGNLKVAGAGNLVFSNNAATASGADGVALGGAISASGSLNLLASGTTAFSNNAATASGANGVALGGAIYLKGGIHRLDNATFSGNTATAGLLADGGAIYIDASGKTETTLTLGGNTSISGNTANGENSGISIGNANAGADSVSKNVNLNIAPGATFSTSSDADGNTVTTRDTFETATLADAMKVALKGADFTLEKTGDGGDFVWSGKTEVLLESVKDADGNAVGGNFNLGFRSGTTTFGSGFALTGTAANTVEVNAGATLKIESGAAFCNFKSMTLDGTAEIAGTLNFENSKVTLGREGLLVFADTASSVIGENTISGALTTRGDVAFTANFPDAATDASLKMTQLYVEKSGEVAFLGASDTQAFQVTAPEIYFNESATLNLGTGTKLLVKTLSAVHPENSLDVAITGTGTLVLLDETAENNTIVFNAYYDEEKKTTVDSTFSLGSGVTVESGILINAGTTLDLGNSAYKTVVIDGGTLTASNAPATAPLNLETLEIASSATIGDGKTTQVIQLPKTTDENGNAVSQKISLNGNMEIAEHATLIAGTSLLNYSTAGLSGAGTLQGDVSGSGNISIAKIDGSANFASNQRAAFVGATTVSGKITNLGRLSLGKDAALTALGGFSNDAGGRATFENGSRFSGAFNNDGTLTVSGASVLEAGSTFTQTENGKLVVESGAMLDFSQISGTQDAVSLAGTLVIDPADFAAGDEFTSLYGLENGQLDALTITDAATNNLTDRVEWSDALGAYVFLGLNGREIATTLYGDFTRENIFRIYDFMRAGLMHASVSTIKPSLFGEKKETSRYMRKYLERQNRFNQDDNKPSVPEAVEEAKPGDFGRAANALMNRAWVQTQYAHTSAGSTGGNLDYAINGWGALLGSSLPISDTWEFGAVFGYNHSRMKHTGTHAHKIDTDAYQLMGFFRKTGESTDGIIALSGAYALNDSERGLNDADFNAWQIGLLLESGVTFRPESWCEIRPYATFQGAYSRTDRFREEGGEDALSLDAADALAARTTFGLGWAFLPFDSVQLSLRAAWNFDIGNSVYRTDAYQASTRSDVELCSREGERSSFDLGASLNFRVNKNVSIYTGYTGTLRSGHEEHHANLGLSVSF